MTVQNHIGLTSCSTLGGSSGSPLFWSLPTTFGTFYFIAGSIFGGQDRDPDVSCEAFTLARAGGGPVAESFRYAPRRSLGVGLAAQNPPANARGGKPFTQVFSTDNDEDRVAVRARNGVSLSDPFREFAVDGTVPAPDRIAAFNEPAGRYRLVVTTRTGDLYTRGEGGAWLSTIAPSSDYGEVSDVDAVYNRTGTDQIFVTTIGGHVLSRRFILQRTDWISILPAGAIYRAVAAVEQSSGLTRLFLVNDAGEVFTSAEVYLKGGGKAWQAPQQFGGVDLPALRDIDAAWVDGTKRIQIFAVDESGRLWTREAKTPSVSAGWNDWQQLESYLDASQNGLRPPPEDIATLTAGHWSEDFSGGGKKSVLFATDSYGNIYYSSEELRCTEPESCKLVRLWRSFYHF